MVSVPYNSKVFHQIRHLNQARGEFDATNGMEFVNDVLGPMIVDHKLHDIFGAILVHRHADIGPDEMLVEFNRCTTPWKLESYQGEVWRFAKSRSMIIPKSWTLTETGDWMPYEFCFIPRGITGQNFVDLNDNKYSDFLEAYKTAVTKANLENVVGLSVWPGNDFNGGLEFSEGTGNFWLVPGEFTEADTANATETMWYFERSKKVRCVCECVYNVRGFHRLIHEHEKQYY